jgi:hypothetical protein
MPSSSQSQHGNPSMFIKTVTQQHNLQHKPQPNDMAKFASGRIPFADAPNPPAASHSQLSQSQSQFKTPGRVGQAAASAAKSSPQYPPGDSIALPEIATDSEDEDSDDGFSVPGWANSPALRELLSQQQLVDPESVFGPIAPLQMDEVFKDSKDRLKKFRDRTSSANWTNQDRLTEKERQRDREAREQLLRDGGWDYRNQGAGSRS